MLDKSGLAAAGRPLEHHRHAIGIGSLEQVNFVGRGTVIRLVRNDVMAKIHLRVLDLLTTRGNLPFRPTGSSAIPAWPRRVVAPGPFPVSGGPLSSGSEYPRSGTLPCRRSDGLSLPPSRACPRDR